MIRGIGLRGAVAVNVITMIGIGPLITIPLVLANLHGSTALVAWVVGAVIALCDGLAWAELGSMYPGSGGTYVFLREAFGRERWGRLLAFLFAWQIVLSAPLVLASGYIGFANYAGYLYPPLATDPHLEAIVAALLAVITLAALYRPIRSVGAIGVVLAGIAIATLAAVIAAALTRFSPAHALAGDPHVTFGGAIAAGLGPALVVTLYDYYGYGASCTIGDEVRDTKRVLPRSVIASIVLVGLLYVALQVGVLGVVSWHELVPAAPGGDVPPAANYVASLVVERTLGSWPARIVTIAILVTAFASTFGNLLAYSRIPFSAARDGVFLAPFARLDERNRFPNVSLAAIGLLAIPACFLSLGDVINALTAGLVIIQSVAQLMAVIAVRAKGIRAPYRMWLFPLPLVVALAGWTYIFFSSGKKSIAFGFVSLAIGVAIYVVHAGRVREWPFARVAAAIAIVVTVSMFAGSPARAADERSAATWGHAAIVNDHGNPVFAVDGKPFFVYGAAFFYERLPRDRWDASMVALRGLGINTLDLYVPWNWHELSDGDFDFSGRTSPRRDLDEVLRLARMHGFKILLRPGPVVRNEWRNGGYPAWLLSRPEYGMPLHDLLEGRYPPTATLQNQHSDDAAAEWMNNATHMTYAKRWVQRTLQECSPYADLILAVALDDDQGAYIDNQTYPAPHFEKYIGDLRTWVHDVTGSSELTYINTYQMKVTAKAPAWAMGNWYQSEAYSIGEHDRSQLEFSTALLHTQPDVPMMTSEFQAGWLEQPGDRFPRGADPSNTLLALTTMFAMGVHGVVNFPAQDTIDPSGWEAPFANSFYAWDAALALDGSTSARFAPTAAFGGLVRTFGQALAASVPQYDGAIAYLGESYIGLSSNEFFAQSAERTIDAQRACRTAALACALIDPEVVDRKTLQAYPFLIVAETDSARGARTRPVTRAVLEAYRKHGGRIINASELNAASLLGAIRAQGRRPIVYGIPGASFARDTTGALAGFLSIVNYDERALVIRHATVETARDNRTQLPPFRVEPHSALILPIDVRLKTFDPGLPSDRLEFADCMPTSDSLRKTRLVAGNAPELPAASGVFTYNTDAARHCNVHVDRSKRNRSDTETALSTMYGNDALAKALVSDRDPVPEDPAKVYAVRDGGARLGVTFRAPALGTALAYQSDVYRDGEPCTVLDNGIVRLVVAPMAGARAFGFVDDATGENVFTTVGAMRDDVSVEPPLSTSDRIAKYTHQFPAGMFNRPYAAKIVATGSEAVASFAYDAPDILPHGAMLDRTVTLEPNARAFTMDEAADFRDIAANDPQRIVSVTSLNVGSSAARAADAVVLAPLETPFAPQTTVDVTSGNAVGYYDPNTRRLATIAWTAGDVDAVKISERDRSIIARLTLARNRLAHVRYADESAANVAGAEALLAADDLAAQQPVTREKGHR